jgi:hypothetical protein
MPSHAKQKGHVSILTCINSIGEYIPNLYSMGKFKGKQQKDEYVSLCKADTIYAMQNKV